MFFKCLFVAVVVIHLPRFAVGGKFNVSLSNLATCEEYSIKSRGYTYADFFHVNSMKNNGIKADERLHLKFYVMTSMDAHILLSEVDNPTKTDRVYEIVLGAGGNSFSAIRIMMSRKRVATALAPDLLSIFDPMPIEIVQSNDGELLVNIPNYAEPHLNYTDDSPLNISYVSFSSYGHIQAKWYYDCQFDGFFGEMEMEIRPISNIERLTADILTLSEPELPPPNVTEIEFSFKVRSVDFDQRSSVLNTRLHLLMEWTDTRLKWNSSEYGDIDTIVQPLFKLWHPELNIIDGAQETFKKFHPFYSIRVNSDGHVRMYARNAELHSWCFETTEGWPNDATDCEIILETKTPNIKLAYDTTSPLTANINKLSEWTIEKVSVLYATYESDKAATLNNSTKALLQSIDGSLKIKLSISRNSAFYHCVFTAPALVSEAIILLSFFLEQYQRGGLNLVALVVLSIAFMFVAKHSPSIIVPDIVKIYSVLMKITTVSYILHIITIWLELYPPKFQPHRYVINVINNSALRLILAMRFKDSLGYVAAQEYPWRELSKILNRLAFVGILITIICINCMF